MNLPQVPENPPFCGGCGAVAGKIAAPAAGATHGVCTGCGRVVRLAPGVFLVPVGAAEDVPLSIVSFRDRLIQQKAREH